MGRCDWAAHPSGLGNDHPLFRELDHATFRVAEICVGTDGSHDNSATTQFAEHAVAFFHRDVEMEVTDGLTMFGIANGHRNTAEFDLRITISAFAEDVGMKDLDVEVAN